VVAGFTLLAIIATWPVAANVSTLIPSPGSAWDPAGFIWDFWQRSTEGIGLWGDATSQLAGYPFGRGFPAAADTTQLVTYGPAWIITGIAGPVVAYNVVVIGGLALAGMAMYALARWLGTGPGIAAWAGGAFVIFPYAIGKAVAHAPLVHLACFPLAVLAGLWWSERPTWRRALVVVAAYAFAWLTNPYYGLMATVVLMVVCGAGVIRIARGMGARAAAICGGTLAGLALLIVLLPVGIIGRSATDATASGISREVIDLDNFGARLSDFITPSGDAFFMRGVNPSWEGVAATGDERIILYLGLTTIAIAVLGAVVAWRATGSSGARLRLAARACAVLAIVLAWFSLASPTTWFDVNIPVPSLWIWEAQPQFRVFARFAAPLMCALLVLGALGIRWVAGRGTTLWRTSIISAAMLITFADLATTIPTPAATPVTAGGVPPSEVAAWQWLRARDDGSAIVQYPTIPEEYTPAGESLERTYAFGQTIHGHPAVNGALFPGQRSFDFLARVSDPTRPGAATDLATAGVRWAVVYPWGYSLLGRAPALTPVRPPRGFAVEKVFPDGTAIWRVTAAPQGGVVVFRAPGFGWGEAGRDVTWHAIQQQDTVITLWAPRDGRYRVVLRLRGAAPSGVSARLDGAPLALDRTVSGVAFDSPAGREPREIELSFGRRSDNAAAAAVGMRRIG